MYVAQMKEKMVKEEIGSREVLGVSDRAIWPPAIPIMLAFLEPFSKDMS